MQELLNMQEEILKLLERGSKRAKDIIEELKSKGIHNENTVYRNLRTLLKGKFIKKEGGKYGSI